jgi:hypothetical protein
MSDQSYTDNDNFENEEFRDEEVDIPSSSPSLWMGISDTINKKFNSEKTTGQVAVKYKNVLAMKKSIKTL